MKTSSPAPSLNTLLAITLINYLAQIPYFIHNYYYPHHIVPGIRVVVLLGVTFFWFMLGYITFMKKIRYGFGLLLSYLIAEGLFYIMSILTGAFFHQIQNPSNINKAIFVVGYISGLTCAFYAYLLFRWHKQKDAVKEN